MGAGRSGLSGLGITKMTPEAQRIAIAEACGWIPFPHPDYKGGILLPYKWSRSGTEHSIKPPDYLRDLNACAQMEEMLTQEQINDYQRRLYLLVSGQSPDDYAHWSDFGAEFTAHATAAQRCEAFLRTKGLWIE